jgi:lipopolysaccharide transport system ATP-binding protein
MEDEEKDPREADPSSLHPQSTIHNPRSAPLKLRDGEFLAVDNVSFELKRGDCLGLIGRNGAGKTTLLKMLTGLIKPDVGRIEMHGRIGALIALGAGFNPILSGRENIYINGSILGLSKKEIDSKIDEIIDFAEINDFIDSPVQSYSSGMQVRLGFAVATTLDPDVLILDEVLAVGDAGFRHKCYSRIGRLQRNAAVIFVSHSMEFVAQICNRVLHLQPGRAVLYSDVTNGVAAYLEENQAQDAETTAGQRAFYPPITNADMSLSRATVNYGEGLDVCLTLEVMHAFHNPIVGLALRSESDHVAAIWNTRHHGVRVEIPAGCSEIRFTIGPLFLLPGKYNCSISVREDGNAEHALWFYNQAQFTVIGQGQPSADVSVLLPYQGHTLNSRIS